MHGAVVIEAPPSVLAPSGQLLGVDGNTRLAAGVPGLGSSVVYSLARYRNYVVVR